MSNTTHPSKRLLQWLGLLLWLSAIAFVLWFANSIGRLTNGVVAGVLVSSVFLIFLSYVMAFVEDDDELWRPRRAIASLTTCCLVLMILSVLALGDLQGRAPSFFESENSKYLRSKGRYLVIEHNGQIEVLTNEIRFNYTDRVLAEYPGVFDLDHCQFQRDGDSFVLYGAVGFNRYGFNHYGPGNPKFYLPPDAEKVALLYKRTGGTDIKEAIVENLGDITLRFVLTLPQEEREALKSVTLEWDVPINSTFHGTGLTFFDEQYTSVQVQVMVRRKEVPQPTLPSQPAERTVKVSQVQL